MSDTTKDEAETDEETKARGKEEKELNERPRPSRPR